MLYSEFYRLITNSIGRFCCLLAGLLLAFGWYLGLGVGQVSGQEKMPVPVIGDATELRRLAGLQKAYADQLIFGSWEADVAIRNAKAHFSLEWSGDSKRVEYSVDSWEGDSDGSRGVAVRHNGQQSILNHDLLLLVRADGLGRNFPDPLELTPGNTWYYLHRQVPWHEMLDDRNPRGNVIEFRVRESPGRILVDRIHEGGSILHIEFSKADGYNIVSYSSLKPDATTVIMRDGEISWAKNQSGFYPETFRAWAYSPKVSRPAIPEISIHTTEFQLQQIQPSRFSIPLSGLRVGTKVSNMAADGRRIGTEFVGGPKARIQRDLLLHAFEVRKSLDSRSAEGKETP